MATQKIQILKSTKASHIQKLDERYSLYVTMESLGFCTDYLTTNFTVTMEKVYDCSLQLRVAYIDGISTRQLVMSTASILEDELKIWNVKFSYCKADNSIIKTQPAFLSGHSWFCDNLFEGIPFSEPSITILCTIIRRAHKINSDPLKPDIKVPNCRALDDIGRSFEEQKFNDVTINVCGKELRAHKVILAARSSVFSAMFENEMSEQMQNKVDIIDMDFEVIREMLRFIYTGKAPNITEKTSELLAAADKYDLQRLKVMCEAEIAKNIAVENAAEILKVADLHNAELLKATAIDFITSNAEDVIETAEYKSMIPTHPYLIHEILRSLVMN